MKAPELMRLLAREPLNYEVERVRGSHKRLKSRSGYPELGLAFHDKDTVAPGLVRKILTKDVGLSLEDALRLTGRR